MLNVKEEVKTEHVQETLETNQTMDTMPQIETKYLETFKISPAKKPTKKIAKKQPNSTEVTSKKTKSIKGEFKNPVNGGECSKPPSSKKKKKTEENVVEKAIEELKTTISTDIEEVKDLEHYPPMNIRIDSRLEAAFHNDLVGVVVEEISLEGLDGITIEALWTRIADAIAETLPFKRHNERLIWNIARSVDKIRFYELPEARPALFIFNRYKYFDWESGHVIEPDEYPVDIYPFSPISDKHVINTPSTITNTVLGSCSTFATRKEITLIARGLSLEEAETQFGSKLIMVADQALRARALTSENADPTIKLTNVQYCILERIGRSRRLGEVTAGQNSLINFGDSKTLFYLRKQLMKHDFITKQPFCIRNKSSGNSVGLLFHLKRFYSEHKSKKQVLIEQVVDMLKKKPKYRMEYAELKQMVGLDIWSKGGIRKLVKTPDFKQFVQTDVIVPYRTMYPNASPKEWKHKCSPKEKSLRVLQLINPSVNVSAAYRDEDQKDDSSDDERIGDYPFNVSIFNHTYNLIFEAGSDGLSSKQVQKKLGLEFYLTRSILNNMVKRNMVDTANVDIGRQHIMKYYARCFNNPEFRDKYNKEKQNDQAEKSIETPCDDNVLDFIAGVLNVDKNYLKSPRTPAKMEEIKEDSPFKGHYEFIKNFRKNNRLEKFNACEKNRYKAENLNQLALRDDADIPVPPAPASVVDKHSKDIYDGILKNFQLHYPMELSIKEKRIEQLTVRFLEPSHSFTLACSDIINDLNKEVKSISFTSQYETVKGRLQMQNLNTLRSVVVVPKHNEPVLLSCSQTVYSVLRYYFFLNVEKEYNIILTTLTNLMNKIHFKVKEKVSWPSELDSDDEHYAEGENSDNWSTIVHAGDSHKSIEYTAIAEDTEDSKFKQVLLTDFENPNFSYRNDDLNDEILYQGTSQGLKRSLSLDEKPAKKPKVDDTENLLVTSNNATENTVKMNMFMGTKPIILCENIDEDGIETIIIISTPPEKYAEIGIKYMNKQLSERSIARANFIIETLRREKMISDLSKLTAMLKMVERKSNCAGTIDKKTLDRLLHKLVSEGYIKMIKIILKYDNVTRVKNMICLPPIDVNAAVQLTIEQMKMSFFIYAKRKTTENLKLTDEKEDEVEDNDCNESLNEMDALFMSTNQTSKYRYSRIAGKHYGYVPKFAKFKLLHEVVFYLAYDYDGEKVDKEDVPKLLKQLNVKFDGINPSDLSPIYKRELSWKMFVPPLPEHKSWPEGWTLVCDIILRLPLSVFVKIYNISYIIPELMPFLNHPLKRHFLLKNIPPNIRNGFLNSRKYIFSIHEIMCNLCYLGLLQFGAQKLRDKDQQFVYVNRNAVLYDTIPSGPGYHQISQIEYEKLSFRFQTETDVEGYWSKMWSISMGTKLGQRYSQLEKTITLQDIHGKTAMIEAMRPKTIQMAAEADIGYIPGDHLGACCLDSSTWVHVKRNWIWASHSKRNRKAELPHTAAVGIRKKHLEQVKLKPIKYRDLQKEINKKKLLKREINLSQLDPKKVTVKKKVASKRKMPIYRKVLPRPPPFRKRFLTRDDLDVKLISKMGKSRSIWSDEEDIALILCKTSAVFLCPNNKAKVVPHTTIRDVMHRLCPSKRKKPSTAYTRRYMKIIKSEDLEGKHKFFYNLDNDKVVQKYFAKFCKRLKVDNNVTDEQVCVAFVYLASYATDHYKLNFNSHQKKLQESGCIDYLTPEDINKFDRSLISKDSDVLYQEPFNEDDIKMDAIKSVIHCSLGWKSDSSDLPLMLYRIYQNFPDYLLRAAILCMREQQIISGKKTPSKHVNVKEVVNVAGSQIHSSFTYSFKQITKYPDYIFPEANEFFTGVHKYKDSGALIVKNFEQGHGLGLSEIATTCKMTLDFKVPNEFLVLDPAISDHSELFQELATRYRLTLTKRNIEENSEENEQESNEQLQKTIERIFESWSANSSDGSHETSEAKQIIDEPQIMLNTTDLAYLLTRGLFPERDDEEQLEKLQKHFLLMFPSSSFNFQGLQEEDAWYQDALTGYEVRSQKLFENIESDCIIKNESEEHNITEDLRNLGANFVDLETSRNIIAFVHEKGKFGATSCDLKNNFHNKNGNLDLHVIITLLLKQNMIIRTGITCFRFVHFDYNNIWTIHLDDQRTISEGDENVLDIGMKLVPWIQINGTVNAKTLQNWLGIILSHCMSFPFVTFNALTKRFNFLKPIDIYYLTEYLQELRCVQLYTYVQNENATLFSNFSHVDKRKANILDDFKSVFIEVDTMAATRFGSFWNRGKPVVKTPFDV